MPCRALEVDVAGKNSPRNGGKQQRLARLSLLKEFFVRLFKLMQKLHTIGSEKCGSPRLNRPTGNIEMRVRVAAKKYLQPGVIQVPSHKPLLVTCELKIPSTPKQSHLTS